jgi:hypothetical protein
MLNIKNYTRMSTLVPLLNCNILDVCDIYREWMMQGTPRKYAKPTCTKNDIRADPRPDGKMM